MCDFIVRDFESSDFEDVAFVWNETGVGNAKRGDNLQVIERTLAHGGAFFVLCDSKSSKIIGTAWFTNDSRRLYLHHFAILSSYQGRGLSHLLMERCMEHVKQCGLQVKLEVHVDNETARNLYQKYGFSRLGDYDVFIIRDVK